MDENEITPGAEGVDTDAVETPETTGMPVEEEEKEAADAEEEEDDQS